MMRLDGPAVALARQTLEDDIGVHAKAIIELKGRLNSLTTISRLPNELLMEILVCVAEYHYGIESKLYHKHNLNAIYTWIKLGHICRSWRAVALNAPRIWGFIILNKGKSVVEEMLARSKKAPLYVTAALGSSNLNRSLLEDILLESRRLIELRLDFPARMADELCAKISGPADMLATLVLHADAASESWDLPWDTNVDLPPLNLNLFGGSFPRLRHLDVRRLLVNWTHPVFSSTLINLVVHNNVNYRSRQQMGTIGQLLASLEQMDRLQELESDYAVPPSPTDTTTVPPPSRKITLPNLRHVKLTGPNLDSAHLLNHLSLHPNFHMTISGRGSSGKSELLNVLNDHQTRSPPLTVVRVVDHQKSLCFWRTNVDSKTPSEPPCIMLTFENPMWPETPSRLIRNNRMFTSVHHLEVDSPNVEWAWNDIVAGMPNLQLLSINANSRLVQLDALSMVLDAGEGAPTLVLPRLRVLQLKGVRLLTSEYGDSGPRFIDELADYLILRCNYDVPLQELVLKACYNVLDENLDLLREIVPEVRWDGIEQFDSESDEDSLEGYDDEDEDDIDSDYHDMGGYFDNFDGFGGLYDM